jgi:hypothetical protein
LNDKQFEYSHANFFLEFSGPFLSFLSKLLDNIKKIANSTINRNIVNSTTKSEKELTLAYTLATVFRFV